MGWQDWQMHNDGLTDEQIETFLATPNSQGGEPTTVDQYRDFETDVRAENGYLLRGVSLMLASLCLFVGAPMLYRLQRNGARLCSIGALIGLVGGVYCSMIINDATQNNLGEAMKLTYQIWVYLLCVEPLWGSVWPSQPFHFSTPVLAWLSIHALDLVQEDE